MTTLDESICWAVLAPVPVSELQRIVAREWERQFPYAIDPPPWDAVAGTSEYAALISRSPGTEGSDRHFSEIISRLATGRTVYSLWFDPERQHIFEWKNGRESASREGNPLDVAESMGFQVARHTGASPALSVAVVEGASVEEVRHALSEPGDAEWVHLVPGDVGVLVTAHDGPLGTQPWDIAERLPGATVYYVQRSVDAGKFSVLVLHGSKEVGRFRVPPLDDDTEMLDGIKGRRTPDAIVAGLGIPPMLLGYP